MTLMPSPSTLQGILLFTQQHLPSRFWTQAVPLMSFQREDALFLSLAILMFENSLNLAKSLQKKGGLSAKDAIHLACASYIDADFFLTCDDRLIKQAKRLKFEIVIINPVDYIRKEAT